MNGCQLAVLIWDDAEENEQQDHGDLDHDDPVLKVDDCLMPM